MKDVLGFFLQNYENLEDFQAGPPLYRSPVHCLHCEKQLQRVGTAHTLHSYGSPDLLQVREYIIEFCHVLLWFLWFLQTSFLVAVCVISPKKTKRKLHFQAFQPHSGGLSSQWPQLDMETCECNLNSWIIVQQYSCWRVKITCTLLLY